MMTNADLRVIYELSGSGTINIGHLQQDPSVGGFINGTDMVGKHFAVLGTTGVGKSSGVAIILNELQKSRPDLRIFLVDPHNEYGRFFGDSAQVLTPRNLKLPFWLFNFEEIVDVFFHGRPGVDEEVEILSEVIPLAKGMYTQYRGSTKRLAAKMADPRNSGFTVETPVPYRLADLITLIDERMGKLENRSSRMFHHRLLTRIETLRNDPRYAFMFDNANVGGDTMAEVLSQLFRMPANGKPMTIMQLAGFPSEVVDAVMSVLCRMAFDFGLWSEGAIQLLFVCEEAHRYASDRPQDRLRPDPPRGLAHRQGRPQVRRVPRTGHAAPGRARSEHHLPVQHAVHDAAVERQRPGVRALGGVGCRRQPADLPAVARDPRSVRVRRGRRAADAADVPGTAGPPAPEGRAHRRSRQYRVAGIHYVRDRTLAQRHHESPPGGRCEFGIRLVHTSRRLRCKRRRRCSRRQRRTTTASAS